MIRRWPIVFLIGCRATSGSSEAPLVVTPERVDGGALVTVPSAGRERAEPPREGCRSDEAIAQDARRFEAALRERRGGEWNVGVDDGVIVARPTAALGEGGALVRDLFDVVEATFPDLVLGEPVAEGHRATGFYCRAERVRKDVTVLSRHGVCLQFRGTLDEIRVDRTRDLPAFAPLVVHDEEEAKTAALGHANLVLKRTQAHAGRVLLVAECDAARRARAIVWSVDVDSADGIDTISIDARTNQVVDTKTFRY